MIAAAPAAVLAPEEKEAHPWRTAGALAATALLLAFVALVFWYQDWRYALPTPRPAGLAEVALGARVELPELDDPPGSATDGRIVFLHFAARDCPCSRFARDHVRELVRAHGREVRFVAVLEGEEDGAMELHGNDSSGLGIPELDVPAIIDAGGVLAARLGVYSTPQAVILDADGVLRFRGNYNLARYCVDPQSEFARLALEAVLDGRPLPAFPEDATRAYGCAVPAELR